MKINIIGVALEQVERTMTNIKQLRYGTQTSPRQSVNYPKEEEHNAIEADEKLQLPTAARDVVKRELISFLNDKIDDLLTAGCTQPDVEYLEQLKEWANAADSFDSKSIHRCREHALWFVADTLDSLRDHDSTATVNAGTAIDKDVNEAPTDDNKNAKTTPPPSVPVLRRKPAIKQKRPNVPPKSEQHVRPNLVAARISAIEGQMLKIGSAPGGCAVPAQKKSNSWSNK